MSNSPEFINASNVIVNLLSKPCTDELSDLYGLYTFVFPAETSGDVLRVSNPLVGPLAKNLDLSSFDVTIP